MRHLLIRVIALLIYPLMVVLSAASWVLRRDPLRLREPRDASLWIERPGNPERADYFSLDSRFEGANLGGVGGIAVAVLLRLARLLTPSRRTVDTSGRWERDQSIPDEVYTLW
jgi:hypothetical protein